jgi:DNA helicase-2/ATP-dependent DNA helicase PcrA
MTQTYTFSEGLNEEQARAVETTEGPLLILAGAGSGKTKTLTHRIAHIVEQGLAGPSQILAVTFTNKAAREMRERVSHLCGEDPNSRSFLPFLGTFHSVCVRLLRMDGEAIGIDSRFVIYDESDRQSLIKRLLSESHLDEKQARSVSSIISNAKNELVTPSELAEVAQGPVQRAAVRIFPLYEKALKTSGALDFDDLIARTVQLLSTNEQIREKWRSIFKYVMIDEYQDTNAAQYKLVKLVTNEKQNICVVGDDWQSIYSWRGADFRNILNFERDYPNATIIKLEQNYRSTKPILDAAHKVISKNSERSDKKLWTAIESGSAVQVIQAANERNEAELIIRRIRTQTDIRARTFSDFAVLYRTNAQSRSIEEQFVRFGIPYRIFGGVRFYDRKEISQKIVRVLSESITIQHVRSERSAMRDFSHGGPYTAMVNSRLWNESKNASSSPHGRERVSKNCRIYSETFVSRVRVCPLLNLLKSS